MPFDPIILWTDALVYLLVGIVITVGWYIRRSPHLRAPWRRVTHSASGMAALTILAFFILIGVLDTIHFRPLLADASEQAGKKVYSVEVLSLFDIIATPLRTRVEKTYSAPLSAYLYAKETVELPDGSQVREFTRLKYGGAHLADPETQRVDDVIQRAIKGGGLGLFTWGLIVIGLSWGLANRNHTHFLHTQTLIWRGATEIPWRVILITLALGCVLLGMVVALSSHYHVLGTDKVGQDVLYQALKSIRTGLVIGTLTTLIMLPFALGARGEDAT